MLRTFLTVLVAASVLTACTGDEPPVVPTGLQAPSLSLATTCNPAGVRATLATLHTEGGAKAFSIPTFNQARSLDPATTEARRLYYAVINYVLGEYAANRLATPARYASTQAGVDFVIGSLYACAGIIPPAGLQDVIDDLGDHVAPNRTACVGDNGLPLQCRLPNGDVVMVAEPGFFIAPAVIIIEPGADPRFDATYPGGRWSPVWRIHVEPLTAQANYPTYTGGPVITSTHPRAAVALCVVDRAQTPHPAVLGLQVAQALETDLQFPPFLLDQVFTFNGVNLIAQLDCTPGTTDLALRRTSPFGSSLLAVQSWNALRSFGSLLGDALTPQPLYAFDGGMGGVVESFESFFAVVDPSSESFDGLDVRNAQGQSIVQNPTIVQSGGSFVATAVPLTYSGESFNAIQDTNAFSCVWTPAAGLSVTPTASTLQATITVTSTQTAYSGSVGVVCTRGTTSQQTSFSVSTQSPNPSD